jgi:hypothetical protein
MRTGKERQPARRTHQLSNVGDGLIRTERKSASEGHSPTIERRARNWSVQRRSQLVRGAHWLSSVEQGTSQDSEIKPASEGDSRTVERRARDGSGQRNKPASEGTHVLSNAERGTGQGSGKKPASEEHSRAVKCRARDWSGQRKKTVSEGHSRSVGRRARDWSAQRKKASQRGTLTHCQAQSEGLVRRAKEGQPARGTHVLSSAEQGSGQNSERKPASEGHSRPVERRARHWSGQRKSRPARALTHCRERDRSGQRKKVNQ